MSVIILNQKFSHDNQSFEIFVKYNKDEQRVIEIKSIFLHTHGTMYPVGNIITKFFKDAIWELINDTDWAAVCKEFCEPEPKLNLNNINPAFHGAFAGII